MSRPLVALSIAGTDSGGAAGLAADLTTFAALGAHGACTVTAVTAQDTTGVHHVVRIGVEDVRAQLEAVLDDLPVGAVKTGMLGSPGVLALVADTVAGLDVPVVVDPVLAATSGARLACDAVLAAYREVLLPQVAVTTPNRDEAARLTGLDPRIPAPELAAAVHALGPAVVLTGGDPHTTRCADVVVECSGALTVLEHDTVATRNDHGTGCTFSAALAVHLGNGTDLPTAVRRAQAFVSAALTTSATWELGRGRGPVAHVVPHGSIPTHEEN